MARNTKPARRVRVNLRLPESLAKRAQNTAERQKRTFTSLTEEALEAAIARAR